MYPPGYYRYWMLDLWYMIPRSKGGVFVGRYFPKEILFRLTKVNKPSVIYLKSVCCGYVILLLIKLQVRMVNKICLFLCFFSTGYRGICPVGCHYYMQALQQAVIFAAETATYSMPDIGTPTITRDINLVFEQVFKEHFKNLHAYACSILKDEDEAEEMVQNVFYKLWEKKEKIGELQSVPAYLYRSVYNECMNYVKHEKVKMTYEAYAVHHGSIAGQATDTATAKELEHRIADALADLPEQCRTIFQLSRFEELKYREIADKMGLSVKTVENQMGKALKILRTKLADYISVVWLLLLTLIK